MDSIDTLPSAQSHISVSDAYRAMLEVLEYYFHVDPERAVASILPSAVLLHHANRALSHSGGKFGGLVHGSILSRVGASTEPGAIHGR